MWETSFPIKRLAGGVLGSQKKKEERITGFGEIRGSEIYLQFKFQFESRSGDTEQLNVGGVKCE